MYGFNVVNIMDLVKRSQKEWDQRAESRKVYEAELKEKMQAAVEKESLLQEDLKAAQDIVKGMEADYLKLQADTEKKQSATVRKKSMTAAKVKSGEVSLREFQFKGKKESEILQAIVENSTKELADSLNVIRAKNSEILELELEIYKQQQIVFSCSLYPGETLRKAYEEQAKFLSQEMNVLFEDKVQSDSRVKTKESDIWLIEGKTLYGKGGHSWNGLTLEKAHAVAFSPIFPLRLIPELEKELKALEGNEESINVVLHVGPQGLKTAEIDVFQTRKPGTLISTSSKDKKRR